MMSPPKGTTVRRVRQVSHDTANSKTTPKKPTANFKLKLPEIVEDVPVQPRQPVFKEDPDSDRVVNPKAQDHMSEFKKQFFIEQARRSPNKDYSNIPKADAFGGRLNNNR